jgi:HK97 gp10 family phage protein
LAQARASMRMTINHFDDARKLFDKVGWSTLKKIGMFLVAESKKRCPVITGYLRGSIRYYISKMWEKHYLTIGATADYAGYVHEGTRYQRKQPFIKDSIMENLTKIQSIAEQEYKNNFKG